MARRRRKSKKWISWLLFLILATTAAGVCYLVWDNYFRDRKENVIESTEQVIEDREEEREEVLESDSEADLETDEKKVVQYEGENPNELKELSGSVTYAGKLNGNVSIRVNIDQFLNEGNCELNILKETEVIYQENTRVVSSASTSTCEGFDFNSLVVSSGRYNIIIKVTSGEKSGLIGGVLEI